MCGAQAMLQQRGLTTTRSWGAHSGKYLGRILAGPELKCRDPKTSARFDDVWSIKRSNSAAYAFRGRETGDISSLCVLDEDQTSSVKPIVFHPAYRITAEKIEPSSERETW